MLPFSLCYGAYFYVTVNINMFGSIMFSASTYPPSDYQKDHGNPCFSVAPNICSQHGLLCDLKDKHNCVSAKSAGDIPPPSPGPASGLMDLLPPPHSIGDFPAPNYNHVTPDYISLTHDCSHVTPESCSRTLCAVWPHTWFRLHPLSPNVIIQPVGVNAIWIQFVALERQLWAPT